MKCRSHPQSVARHAGAALAFTAAVSAASLLGAPSAAAHAELRSSDPAEGAALNALPATMTLTFTEAPSPGKSLVTLGATRLPLSPVAGRPDALAADLRGVPGTVRGPVTVAWRSVSADDGHVADGVIRFSVGAAAPSARDPAPAAARNTGADGGLGTTWYLVLAAIFAAFAAAAVGLTVRRSSRADRA
jgi:copper resistance protein C